MTRDGALPASGGGGAAEGPRRCSQCGHHGHNARTCTARGPVKLFGVRIGDKPPTAAAGGGGGMRKSASMVVFWGTAPMGTTTNGGSEVRNSFSFFLPSFES